MHGGVSSIKFGRIGRGQNIESPLDFVNGHLILPCKVLLNTREEGVGEEES